MSLLILSHKLVLGAKVPNIWEPKLVDITEDCDWIRQNTESDTQSQIDTQSSQTDGLRQINRATLATHKSESWWVDGKKLDFVLVLATLPTPSFLFQTAGKVKVWQKVLTFSKETLMSFHGISFKSRTILLQALLVNLPAVVGVPICYKHCG